MFFNASAAFSGLIVIKLLLMSFYCHGVKGIKGNFFHKS